MIFVIYILLYFSVFLLAAILHVRSIPSGQDALTEIGHNFDIGMPIIEELERKHGADVDQVWLVSKADMNTLRKVCFVDDTKDGLMVYGHMCKVYDDQN